MTILDALHDAATDAQATSTLARALRETDDRAAQFHDDLIVLTEWMAATGDYDASEVADAVRKPHKWADELPMIRSANAHRAEHKGHQPYQDLNGTWMCDDHGPCAVSTCSWPTTST